jgi:hypothetical protein
MVCCIEVVAAFANDDGSVHVYLIAMAQNLKRLVLLFYYWFVTWWVCRQRTAQLHPRQSILSRTFSTGPNGS